MPMTEEKLKQFEASLTIELATLEKELLTVGRRNPNNNNDWEPISHDLNTVPADENESADGIEEYESNTAILKQLEIRYNEVLKATEKIKNGNFGICEIGNESIEEDRLEANPSARTCKLHMNEEASLS